MEQNHNLISVIIPCRNEEEFIEGCIDSIVNQNFPKENLEILVMDGMSNDRTREVIKNYERKYSFIRLIDNPEKVTPKGMNLGIKNSRGEVIIFLNAHSVFDKDFLKWTVYYLKNKPEAAIVGGTFTSTVKKANIISETIALVLDSVFGSGGIRYRQREKEGFIKDTLPFAAYRRSFLEKIGYMDEDLLRGQDAELNLRILKLGGKIYFSPKIKSYVYVRSSLKKLFRQQFQYGYFKVKIAQKLGFKSILRQLIPSIFVLGLFLTGILSFFLEFFLMTFLIILGTYFFLDLLFSLQIGIREGLQYFPIALFVFFLLHFSYGTGFLFGILIFLIFKRKSKDDIGINR